MTTNMKVKNKWKQKQWTQDETIALLKSYISRKDEFQYRRRKRKAYKNILSELITRGELDPSTTSIALEIKMQTLLRTFRSGKFNDNHLPITPYLETIFGDTDMYSNEVYDETTPIKLSNEMEEDSSCHQLNLNGSSMQSMDEVSIELPIKIEDVPLPTPVSPVDIKDEIPSRNSSIASHVPLTNFKAKQKKRISRELYYAKMVKLYEKNQELKMQQKERFFKEWLENSERRHREIEDAKMQRHQEKMNFLKNAKLK